MLKCFARIPTGKQKTDSCQTFSCFLSKITFDRTLQDQASLYNMTQYQVTKSYQIMGTRKVTLLLLADFVQ